jgi:hypothetical protein
MDKQIVVDKQSREKEGEVAERGLKMCPEMTPLTVE